MSEYESREEEEVQIYPDDIEIIEDPNQWKPSKQQILAYAVKMGYIPFMDSENFLEIAKESLMKPLPNKWRRAFRAIELDLMYIDLTTNEIHLVNNIEESAKAELEKEREMIYQEQLREYLREEKLIEEQKKSD